MVSSTRETDSGEMPPITAKSKPPACRRLHELVSSRMKDGTLGSLSQRRVAAVENSGSSEMIATVGRSTVVTPNYFGRTGFGFAKLALLAPMGENFAGSDLPRAAAAAAALGAFALPTLMFSRADSTAVLRSTK